MTGWVILVDQPKDLPNAEIKETDRGFIVMEVNDSPNLEHGIEDQVGKDEIWTRLLKWFVERFEQ